MSSLLDGEQLRDSCSFLGGNADEFPCNMSMISVASLGLAAGGVSLLFVLYLIRMVSKRQECSL